MISIIVPVYNAEKYIRETINSILNQDFTDYELVLVNDGSKDNSLEICREYEHKYPQIHVFDQKNSGVSAARNKGICEARGEYIAFADADDLLEKDMLSVLYKCAIEYNADVVSCGAGLVEDGKIVKEEYGTNTLKVYDTDEALRFFLIGNQVNIGVWTKLFKRELVDGIKFLEDKRINEDKFFIFEALMKAKSLVVYDVTKYLYCKREGSATMKTFDARWFDSLDIADLIVSRIFGEKADLINYAKINQIKSYYWLLLKMYRTQGVIDTYTDQYKRIVKKLKQSNVWKIRKYLTTNMFTQILLLQISEPILRMMKQKR